METRHSCWEQGLRTVCSSCRSQCPTCRTTASEPSSPPLPGPALPLALRHSRTRTNHFFPARVPLSFSGLHLRPCRTLLTSKGPSQTANQFPPQFSTGMERVGPSGPLRVVSWSTQKRSHCVSRRASGPGIPEHGQSRKGRAECPGGQAACPLVEPDSQSAAGTSLGQVPGLTSHLSARVRAP